jgi:hypothetical protein
MGPRSIAGEANIPASLRAAKKIAIFGRIVIQYIAARRKLDKEVRFCYLSGTSGSGIFPVSGLAAT